jgi:WD40 repeat protein
MPSQVGYGDGTMRLFDLKSGEVLHSLTGSSAHTSSVASLAVKDDNNLLASGGVDGTAKLFNTQSGKSIGTFACGMKQDDGESKSTVESMVFTRSEQNFLVTGSLDGLVSVWDLSTQVCNQDYTVLCYTVLTGHVALTALTILLGTSSCRVKLFPSELVW